MNKLLRDQLSGGGLSNSSVYQRQLEEGFNELPYSKPRRTLSIIFDVLKEPMVYILLACGAIYFVLGDQQEAIMLLGFLFLIIAISVVQETKASRALEALKDLSSPRALVLRNGQKKRIPGREVVREDLIFLNEGDRVPADSEILSSQNLLADESLLTGESMPVNKEIHSLVYSGTTIVGGQGMAIVKAIGTKTEMGKIGKSIQSSDTQPTSLEQDSAKLVKRLAWVATLICLLVVIIYGMKNGNWLEGGLAGLALAMAIMPNELAAVLTIFLALGAWRLSQRRVLTRKLSAVENLGAATILCVDKTGTLTLNQMTIQKLYGNGKFVDLFELEDQALEEDFHEVLEFGILASRKDPFDPMELAFIHAGNKFLKGTEHLHSDWDLKKEYPLSPELLSISYAWKPSPTGGFIIGGKGAPEAIIDLCHLPNEEALKLAQVAQDMARERLRVLGVAKAHSQNKLLPDNQHDFEFKFLGFIGIVDPVRSEVPKAISECLGAGIKIIMMTGDHPQTASSIANKIGLPYPNEILTGSEIEKMTDEEIYKRVSTCSVFSRVMPHQKLRLVEILKKNKEVVVMTGDGVNDAPALKSSHIGIAMGSRGTDVARESSDLVLLDDDFSSIVEAIRMGRRIYINLRGAFIYLLAVHVPIAGMSILPIFFGLPLLFFPAHIAFIHLIIEPVSSVAFETAPGTDDVMMTPPRKQNEKLLNRHVLLSSLSMGLSILITLIGLYFFSVKNQMTTEESRAMVFTTLIIANSLLVFMSRGTKTRLKERLNPSKNKVGASISLGSILLLLVVFSNTYLKEMFKMADLKTQDIFLCVVMGIISVLWTELIPKKKM